MIKYIVKKVSYKFKSNLHVVGAVAVIYFYKIPEKSVLHIRKFVPFYSPKYKKQTPSDFPFTQVYFIIYTSTHTFSRYIYVNRCNHLTNHSVLFTFLYNKNDSYVNYINYCLFYCQKIDDAIVIVSDSFFGVIRIITVASLRMR